MEFVDNLRDFGTAVHALRWVLLFIIVACLTVTIAVMAHAARLRQAKTDRRPIFIDPLDRR